VLYIYYMFARARREIEVDFTWKRERKKTLDVKLQKYFCDKCTKLLTKRKKCGTMLFGQERICVILPIIR
jgi:RNase P subunit RPR2